MDNPETTNAIALVAILVSLFLWLGDKIWVRYQDSKTRRQQDIAYLISLHEYFLIVIKRLKEYIDFETPIALIPSFRIPLMTLDKGIDVAGTLFKNQSDIQTILKTLEEFTHINLRWDGLAEEANELRIKQWETDGTTDAFKLSQKSQAMEHFVNAFHRNKINTNFAAKVIYNLAVDSLKIVEDRITQLKKDIRFAEGYQGREASKYVLPPNNV